MNNTINRGQSTCSKYNASKSLKSRLQAVSAPTESEGKDILIAALKDPFFQIRVQALQKLANYDLNAKEMAMVEKNCLFRSSKLS